MDKFISMLDTFNAFLENFDDWMTAIDNPKFDIFKPKYQRENQRFISKNRKLSMELDIKLRAALNDLLEAIDMSETQFEKLLQDELDRRDIVL